MFSLVSLLCFPGWNSFRGRLATFFSFQAVEFLRRPGGRKLKELVSPQLPLCRGQGADYRGAPPWVSQTTSITLISPRKATYCLGLGQGGISISQLHLCLSAKNRFIFGCWSLRLTLEHHLHFQALCRPLGDNFLFSPIAASLPSKWALLPMPSPRALLYIWTEFWGALFLLLILISIEALGKQSHQNQHYSKKS